MKQHMQGPMHGLNPCYQCTEKFIYCHGQCPKDKRGEYGYEAWRKDLQKVKEARKQYEKNRYSKFPRT